MNIIQSQNHYLVGKDVVVEKLPVQSIIFQLATNIKPKDVRSLLGNELPGFFAYENHIYFASQGTDDVTLSHESAPPMEVLLKEREIAQEQINQYKENHNETAPPSERTMEEELVYIYHSHSYESFLPLLKDATIPVEAISNNPEVNVIAVGNMLKKELKNKGINANHDMTNVTKELHARGWKASQAYQYSREGLQEVLATNNEVKYVIDIHRDSARKEHTTAIINGKSYAKVMFVVGESHKDYKKNMEFATKLDNAMEAKYPGISRKIWPKNKSQGNGVYGQDLSNKSILLEVGGVDNNLEELHNTIKAFAEVYSEILWKEKDAGAF
ncbi:stage II sporulation protein P [Sutcliffiella halmapala]|uniref:stage II sporulation protein P n=1 Tax=Sutcliffiella halmapala TaxID=79882 RepID=UPI0009958281|nr:stage II sporulation protein P [Sutcliffiella halmapala]